MIAPLAPERFKVQVTISRETDDKLRRVQNLLRHSVPNGDPAEIFDRALTLLLVNLEKRKLALTKHPRPAKDLSAGSRHVPAVVRRDVWQRDEGRCAFIGATGRCAERAFLEFHHVVPFADGGETTTTNLLFAAGSTICMRQRAYSLRGSFERGRSYTSPALHLLVNGEFDTRVKMKRCRIFHVQYPPRVIGARL